MELNFTEEETKKLEAKANEMGISVDTLMERAVKAAYLDQKWDDDICRYINYSKDFQLLDMLDLFGLDRDIFRMMAHEKAKSEFTENKDFILALIQEAEAKQITDEERALYSQAMGYEK